MWADDSDDDIICLTPARGRLGNTGPNHDRLVKSDREFGLRGWDVGCQRSARPKREDDTCWESLTSEASIERSRPRFGNCNRNPGSQAHSPKGRKTSSTEYEYCPIPAKARRLSHPPLPSPPKGGNSYYERLFQPTIVPNPLYEPPTSSKVIENRAACVLKPRERPKSPSLLKDLNWVVEAEENSQTNEQIVPDFLNQNSHVKSVSTPVEVVNVAEPEKVPLDSAQTILVELSDSDTDFEIVHDDDAAYRERLSASSSCEQRQRNYGDGSAASENRNDRLSPEGQREAQVIGLMVHSETVSIIRGKPDRFIPKETVPILSDTGNHDETRISNNSAERLENAVVLTEKEFSVELVNSSQKLSDKHVSNEGEEQSPSKEDSVVAEVIVSLQPCETCEVEQLEASSCVPVEKAITTSKLSKTTENIDRTFFGRDEIPNASNETGLSELTENGENHKRVEIICSEETISCEHILAETGTADPAEPRRSINKSPDINSVTICDENGPEELQVIAEIEEVPFTPLDSEIQQSIILESTAKQTVTMDDEICSELQVSDRHQKPGNSCDSQKFSKNVPPLQNFSAGINQVLYEPSVPTWYTGTFKRIKEVLSKRKISNM